MDNSKIIFRNFNSKVVHYLELEDRFAIDGSLLGKHIFFKVKEDCYIDIVIPSIIRKEGYDSIGISGIKEEIGIDSNNWGKINCYQGNGYKKIVDAWIAEVLIVCYSNNKDQLLDSFEIQSLGRSLLHKLHIINPDAVRIPSDNVLNNLCKVDTSVSFKDDGKPYPELLIRTIIDSRNESLSIHNIIQAIRDFQKTISLPYEMLENARVSFSHSDTRSTVLNCATAIETVLKRLILGYFEDNAIPEALRKIVFERVDGYSKLVELCKKLSIPLDGLNNVQERVANVRNRVIHGGYTPSFEEANQAYQCIKQVLSEMNVQLYE